MTHPDELAFDLKWLLSAAEKKPAVDVCSLGHLRVTRRTCWTPDRLAADLTAIWFRWIEHEEAACSATTSATGSASPTSTTT